MEHFPPRKRVPGTKDHGKAVREEVAFEEYMNPRDLKAFANKLHESSILTTRYDELIKNN